MTNITVGIISKRINSTSNSMSNTVSLSCKLLDGCSEHTPVFRVSGLNKSTLYNYLSWGNYYYWIDDIRYLTNDIQELVCHLDPFATGKSNILNSSGFVEYSNSSNWNDTIDDNRMMPEHFFGSASITMDMFDYKTSPSGSIIMTFTQTASLDWMLPDITEIDSGCGIHTAILTWANFRACLGDLLGFGVTVPDPTIIGNIGEACAEIVQAFARSMQSTGGGSLVDNIIRCIWVPFDYTDLYTKTSAILHHGLMLGGVFASNTTWYEIPNVHIYSKKSNYTINDIGTVTKNHKFLRHPRFTSLQVGTPTGYCPIDNSLIIKTATPTLYFKTTICLSDGSWALKISSTSGYVDTLAGFSGNVGINLMGDIYSGPTTSSMLGDAVMGVTKTALSMGIGSFLSARFGNSADLLTSNQSADFASLNDYQQLSNGICGSFPTMNGRSVANGSFGGSACSLFINGDSTSSTAVACQCYIYIETWGSDGIYDDAQNYYSNFCNRYGYPCNKYLSLTNYSGYVKTVGISVQGGNGLNQSELATINSYMNNTGIYIE